MSKCLNPIVLTVGLRKDKNIYISTENKKRNPFLKRIDEENKKPSVILAPCGKCYNCRLSRARSWTLRTIHEYTLPEYRDTLMYFITLTYDNKHIGDNSLNYRHVQLFLKKLRQEFKDSKLRFLCVGEYGHKSGRMHFHLLVFGFREKVKYQLFHSLWQYGNVDIDVVRSYSAIAYMLKYAFKDYLIDKKQYLLDGRTPPLFRCSKGFGKTYALKNIDDDVKTGYIKCNGYKYKIPRYYREIFYKINNVDGWQEYQNTLVSCHLRIRSELLKYSFVPHFLEEFEIGSKYYYIKYLKLFRPIFLHENKKLYDNYFSKFYEKI